MSESGCPGLPEGENEIKLFAQIKSVVLDQNLTDLSKIQKLKQDERHLRHELRALQCKRIDCPVNFATHQDEKSIELMQKALEDDAIKLMASIAQAKENDIFNPVITPFGQVHFICFDPMIVVVDDFFDKAELEWIQTIFQSVKDELDGAIVDGKIDMDIRRAKLKCCSYHSSLAQHFRSKLRALMGSHATQHMPEHHMQFPVLQHYDADGFVLHHYDAGLDDGLYGRARRLTALCYLNDLKENQGGETDFLLAGIKVRPKPGRLLLWANSSTVQENGLIFRDPLALHAGLKVVEGEKQIMTMWQFVSQDPLRVNFDKQCKDKDERYYMTLPRPETVTSPTRKRKAESEAELNPETNDVKSARIE